MSLKEEIEPKLYQLLKPYENKYRNITLKSFIIKDLGVNGTDYLDLMEDIEREFELDLTEFVIGENPEYVSNGLIGYIIGKKKSPVFRDFSVEEINNLLKKYR